MKILHLVLKKVWFDMIASGDKNLEYREIKPYWVKRFIDWSNYPKESKNDYKYIADDMQFDLKRYPFKDVLKNYYSKIKSYDVIIFKHGYSKNSRKITVKWEGLSTGYPISGLSEEGWLDTDVFIIKLGEIIKP